MGNLLRVNFVSIFKNKLFWIAIIAAVAVIYMDLGVQIIKTKDELIGSITYGYMTPVVVIASLIPFVVGSDFDGGIIRNKIMAGLSKGQIYLADVIVSCFCSVIIAVVSFASWFGVVISMLGLDRIGRWFSDSNFTGLIVSIFIHLLCILIAVSLISTALTVIGENKAIAIVGILTVMIMGTIVSDSIRRYATDTNKETFIGFTDDFEPITEPNPYYVPAGTPKKYMYLVLDSVDIVGQIHNSPIDYVDVETPEDYRIPVRYDIGVLSEGVLISVLALIVFKHKNVK